MDAEQIATAEFVALLNGERDCRRCGAPYREIDNLGHHRCSYHPLPVNGYYSGVYPRGVYECCGRRPNDGQWKAGCTPCDHTASPGHEPTVILKPQHSDMLGLKPGVARSVDPLTGEMIVHRLAPFHY